MGGLSLFRKLVLAVSAVLCGMAIHATEPGCPGSIQWDAGAGTTAWTTITNWSSNNMPVAADDVCIPDLATGVEVVHSTGTHAVHSLAGTGGLQVSGGTLSFSTASPGLGQLTVSGGALSGPGNLPVSGAFAWSAGTMSGAGTTTVINGTISSFGFKDLGSGRVLETSGTTTWFAPGGLRLNGGASIRADGVWNMGDASMTTPDGTGSLLIPSGATFNKSGGGTGTLGVPLTIAGTLAVQSGTLSLAAGSVLTGTIQGSASSKLQFSGGSHAIPAGKSVTAGAIEVGGGSLTVDGTYSATSSSFFGGITQFRPGSQVTPSTLLLANTASVEFSTGQQITIYAFNMSGGTLLGSDSIAHGFAGSHPYASWAGGEMRGPGVTWLQTPELAVFGSAAKDLTEGRVLQTLTVTWEGTGPIRMGSGARIRGSDWNLNSDAALVDLGGAGRFQHEYGEFAKRGGSGTSVVGVPFTNVGTVRAYTGTLQFTGGYTQTVGATIAGGGTLASTTPLEIQGGTLTGGGAVLASVVIDGTVEPGLSSGILSIGGRYTQTSAGKLAIELGGLAPGSQHDRLDITGAASLGGTLQASLVGGFVPQDGNTFTVLTASAIDGYFETLSLPALPGGLAWSVGVQPMAVVLAVSSDLDGDGVGDAGDCAPSDPGVSHAPVEVAGVGFQADKQTLAWRSQAAYAGPATVYDLVRGGTADLPVGGSTEACLASGAGATQLVDVTEPDAATSFYYLVRARNACGVGTYGTATGGAPRTPVVCP